MAEENDTLKPRNLWLRRVNWLFSSAKTASRRKSLTEAQEAMSEDVIGEVEHLASEAEQAAEKLALEVKTEAEKVAMAVEKAVEPVVVEVEKTVEPAVVEVEKVAVEVEASVVSWFDSAGQVIVTSSVSPVHSFGWVKDKLDPRDHILDSSLVALTSGSSLPSSFSLRDKFPEVYNQEGLGACTGNAIASDFEYERARQGFSPFKADDKPSRLFIYYNERLREGTTDTDSGAQVRDGFKAINQYGVCGESLWPYSDANPGPFQTQPNPVAYYSAHHHRAVQYMRVGQDINLIKQCIFAGYPVVFGFLVFDSFESQEASQTGIIPMPQQGEGILGGHCVPALGWDDSVNGGSFENRNSWGADWGKAGDFWMPYDYYLQSTGYVWDLWCIKLIDA